MELFEEFKKYLGKVSKVRWILTLYMVGVVICIVVLIIALISADNSPMVATNNSDRQIVLTQEFLRSEFELYQSSKIIPEFIAFIVVSAIGIAALFAPFAILYSTLTKDRFKWSHLAYIIPLPVIALICALFSYMLGSSSIPHLRDRDNPFTIERTTVTTLEAEPVPSRDDEITSYRYYIAFDNEAKRRYDDNDYELFLNNGTEYYVVRTATGLHFKYYPVNDFALE